MSRNRPDTTGYERLAKADRFSDDSDVDGDAFEALAGSSASLQPASEPCFAPITQPRPHSGMTSPRLGQSLRVMHRYSRSQGSHQPHRSQRDRSNSGSGRVDLKAINARLERWADEITAKFMRKRGRKISGEGDEIEPLEIHHSVFQPPEGLRPITAAALAVAPEAEGGQRTRHEFEVTVESVRLAIEQGIHPRMILQGSSGSYFARNPEGKVVGVFKPKDEEPYAAGNPKWNKWIHRNLFPCCFGRACLIPNLSYVSEAAAYVLDVQLRTHLVPHTDVVWLASKSFHYPFWDRYNYSRKKKPLPAKPGSFQVFLKDFKDANVFLREHPWPDQYLSGFRTNDPHRKRKRRWAKSCGPTSSAADGDSGDNGQSSERPTPGPDQHFGWTETLRQSFREELEKLVILDYIMRNTDRGLDNWMIKVDWVAQEASIASKPVHLNTDVMNEDGRLELGPQPVDMSRGGSARTRGSYATYRTQKPMDAKIKDAKFSIGAIDNSLSWPWKHPDAWRSFPFGWLFLPVDLIGRPFSQRTRDHFLPLLTSTAWWSQTQLALRKVFQIDPDFQERMFARQMAVMKGQAWNVVETLKMADHGPLELARRAKVCVWDDLVDVPVAVSMRATSAEMLRRGDAINTIRGPMQEEMDLGSVLSAGSVPSVKADLLGTASPPVDLPRGSRFELSGPSAPNGSNKGIADALGHLDVDGEIPAAWGEITNASHTTQTGRQKQKQKQRHHSQQLRPDMPRSSLSQPYLDTSPRHHHGGSLVRRSSFGKRSGNGSSIAAQMYAAGGGDYEGYDDGKMDGDLGYAAAEGMEGSRRQVIVERLEMIKGGDPWFTCC